MTAHGVEVPVSFGQFGGWPGVCNRQMVIRGTRVFALLGRGRAAALARRRARADRPRPARRRARAARGEGGRVRARPGRRRPVHVAGRRRLRRPARPRRGARAPRRRARADLAGQGRGGLRASRETASARAPRTTSWLRATSAAARRSGGARSGSSHCSAIGLGLVLARAATAACRSSAAAASSSARAVGELARAGGPAARRRAAARDRRPRDARARALPLPGVRAAALGRRGGARRAAAARLLDRGRLARRERGLDGPDQRRATGSTRRCASTTRRSATASRPSASCSGRRRSSRSPAPSTALGIERIEAGFPRVTDADRRAIELIRDAGLRAEVWGFSRAVQADVEALLDLGLERSVIESPISDLKLRALGVSQDDMVGRVRRAVELRAPSAASRSAGSASTARAPIPRSSAASTRRPSTRARPRRPSSTRSASPRPRRPPTSSAARREWLGPDVPVHFHGHNDFGLATAAAVAAVEAGATWIQGTINGMGERAGNANLAEIALALRALYGVETASAPRPRARGLAARPAPLGLRARALEAARRARTSSRASRAPSRASSTSRRRSSPTRAR